MTTDRRLQPAHVEASRRRILVAADESRHRIEQTLHEGAQQHLVALAVKLGLAEQLCEDDPATTARLLGELRADVRVTIAQVRELARRVFPPLLRERGLGEALRGAAIQSPAPCTIQVDVPQRFAPELESTIYFSVVEAMRQAGSGARAAIAVRVGLDDSGAAVEFVAELTGPADAQESAVAGASGEPHADQYGMLAMRDRLEALGGQLELRADADGPVWIRGCVPVSQPLIQPHS